MKTSLFYSATGSKSKHPSFPGEFTMFLNRPLFCLILLTLSAQLLFATQSIRAEEKPALIAEEAGESFKVQGEYEGELQMEDGKLLWGAQVIALGNDEYAAYGYPGGLPGAGADMEFRIGSKGKVEDGVMTFRSDYSVSTWKDETFEVRTLNDELIGTMKKVKRESPTLGAEPPEGAIVLFDGTSAEGFVNGKMTEDGLLIQGTTSKETFQDCTVHVEFMLSYMPWAREQQRSNSGCYLQGRYEVQVLDSFGLEGRDNECGGIYTVSAPSVNMCLPPLSWQTYDIEFTAAKFDPDGKKVSSARMSVKHNGVTVQNDVEVTYATRAAPNKEGAEPGPLYLQDHNNPVRYRNIWIVKK